MTDDRAPRQRRAWSALSRPVIAVYVLAAIASAILLIDLDRLSVVLQAYCAANLGNVISADKCGRGLGKARIYILAVALLPLIWVLEKLRPVDPEQPIFSGGLLVDSLWLILFPVTVVGLVQPLEGFLAGTFGPALADYKLQALAHVPLPVQLAAVIILSDLLAWGSHYIRHKVWFLWEFHKVHHSQRELNFFSSVRLHFGDYVANALLRFLPFTLLGLRTGITAFLIWATFARIYEMFVHSNVKTDLGLLRYILVSPQSHRIHHSIEPRHVDRNFGNVFVFWDFLFRTQWCDFNDYPKLGIDDANCSTGGANTIAGALRTFMSEQLYPFRAIATRLFAQIRSSSPKRS